MYGDNQGREYSYEWDNGRGIQLETWAIRFGLRTGVALEEIGESAYGDNGSFEAGLRGGQDGTSITLSGQREGGGSKWRLLAVAKEGKSGLWDAAIRGGK